MTAILLVKTHAFGDALLSTPAARALLARNHRVTVLAGPSSRPVWERQVGLESVICAPFPPSGPAGALALLGWTLRMRRRLRRFPLVVYLGRSASVRRWLRLLTGSPMRSGGDSPLGSWETVVPQRPQELASEAFARMAGAVPDSLRPSFEVRASELEWAASRLESGRWLAVVPGGGDNPRDSVPEKRWTGSGFARVCREALRQGTRVVLLGGPSDVRAAAEVERQVPEVMNLTGVTDWGKTAAILKTAGRFLGCDSGPAHLAAAVGAHSVVLFGPTSPGPLYAPGLVEPVLSPAPCSPCYENMPFPGCSRDGSCMAQIDPDSVVAALEPVLEGGGEL